MRLTFRFFRRLAILAFAYALACLLSGFIISIVFTVWMTSPGTLSLDLEMIGFIGLFALFCTGLVFVFTCVPALVAIAYAERRGIDSPVWFVFAGALTGIAGVAAYAVVGQMNSGGGLSSLWTLEALQVLWFECFVAVTTGICAALLYWFLTIRLGGRFRM